MTWVKGTTTWGQLEHLLAQLACGEVADGSGTTVAAASRWLREVTRSVTDLATTSTSTTVTSASASFAAADIGALVIATGVPLGTTIASVTNTTTAVLSAAATATGSGITAQIATNTIRTPASQDIATGDCANRTGYFLNLGVTASSPLAAGNPGTASVARVTAPFTTLQTASLGRSVVRLFVTTPNTVAGNYSTAVITATSYDPETGATVNLGNQALNAAGLAVGYTGGLQVTFSDPSGLLTSGTVWARAFKTGYLYGIDAWPMLPQAAAAPTFTVAPPGTAGTDWDVLADAVSPTGIVGPAGQARNGILFHGLGIKSATGLGTGALYTVSWPMALLKLRMFLPAANSAALSLDIGQSKRDTVNTPGTFRATGLRISTWLQAFSSTLQTAATAVQYWASITADGIVLAVNADTAASGKLGTGYCCKMTPYEPTYDPFPIQFNQSVVDYTADNSLSTVQDTSELWLYYSTRRRLDGSEGTRDWQTRWMRGEHLSQGMFAGSCTIDITGFNTTVASGVSHIQVQAIGEAGNMSLTTNPWSAPRLAKPGPDGKWLLHGHTYGEQDWVVTSSNPLRTLRGTQTTRFAYLSGDGWGSGDELTDTATGQKWFLLMPDYAAYGHHRTRSAVNTYAGGVAIAEL